MTNDELDLITTQQLLDTLARRFESCIFAASEPSTEYTGSLPVAYWGSAATAIGLCEIAKARVMEGIIDTEDMEEE